MWVWKSVSSRSPAPGTPIKESESVKGVRRRATISNIIRGQPEKSMRSSASWPAYRRVARERPKRRTRSWLPRAMKSEDIGRQRRPSQADHQSFGRAPVSQRLRLRSKMDREPLRKEADGTGAAQSGIIGKRDH